MGVLYVIKNKINGKEYVGQTIGSLKQRIYGHKSSLKYGGGRRTCSALVEAFKKYGFENFDFIEIGIYKDIDKLNEAEQAEIKRRNSLTPNGYNISLGGKNTFKTESIRKKMSENHHSKKPGYKPVCKKYVMYKGSIKYNIENMAKFCRENNLPYRRMIYTHNRGYGICYGYSPIKNWNEVKYKEYTYIKDGKEVRIRNLTKYCDDNKLSRTKMIALSTGRKLIYKGYINVDVYRDKDRLHSAMKSYNYGLLGWQISTIKS